NEEGRTRLMLESSSGGREWLVQRDEIPVGGKHQEFALSIALIHRPVDIGLRQGIKLRLQFRIKAINVTNIDVIGEAAITGRSTILAMLLEQAKPRCVSLEVGVIAHTKRNFKSQNFNEEA